MEPSPSNVSPWYLRNINQALALDEASGNVYVRTGFEGNIIISGNVNIPGNIDAHISEIGNSGNLTVPWMPVSIDGNSNVVVTGNVDVTGNVNANVTGGNITVAGNVAVTSIPAITGNVNANITGGNVNAAVTGTVTANQGTSPWVVSGNVNANISSGNITATFSSSQSDAFGRLRVSNPQTLFDTQNIGYDHNQFATATAGSGTSTYDVNSSTYALSVGTTTGSYVYRETTRVFPYQPGKSLLIYATFCMNAAKTNLRQRVGYFTTNNGIYFQVNNTTKSFVIRSYSTGSIIEDKVDQASWNGDKLDGTGPSGLTLDISLDQIFWCDIEWLGVGSVRLGFVINGVFITCHTYCHTNTASVPGVTNNTTTYMQTACLPIRYEIENTGITTGNSTLRQICSSVISEGGYALSGQPQSIGHPLASPVRLPNDGTFKPLISIRLKSGFFNNIVLPTFYSIAPLAQANFQFRVYGKAITTGGTWTSFGSNSAVEYNLAPASVTSGEVVTTNYIIASNQTAAASSQIPFGFSVQLGRDTFTNTAYEYVLTACTTGTNQDVLASLEWQEVN